MCDAGGNATCTQPDSCQSGVCSAGGGGDSDGDKICDADDNCLSTPNEQSDLDGDGQGDACDPSDAQFNLTSAKFGQSRESKDNGGIRLKGDVVTTPPRDTFATASGIDIRVTDGYGLDQTHSWSASDCPTTRSGTVRCRNADHSRSARFSPIRSTPSL
jgi:hypothetical protein